MDDLIILIGFLSALLAFLVISELLVITITKWHEGKMK